jgi:hypothetical protein
MPLIILPHVSDEDRMVEALRAGVDGYLTKPFSPRELVVRLEAHMRRATVAHDEPVEAVASASLSAPASHAVCAAGRARCARLEDAGVSAAAGYGARASHRPSVCSRSDRRGLRARRSAARRFGRAAHRDASRPRAEPPG